MKLPPYEIPEQDADLWECGVVLAERPMLPKGPLPPLPLPSREMKARRAARVTNTQRASLARRASHLAWLYDRIAGRTDPGRVSHQPTAAEAAERVKAARARWGDAEFQAVEAIVAEWAAMVGR
jgi:hypothetical protein